MRGRRTAWWRRPDSRLSCQYVRCPDQTFQPALSHTHTHSSRPRPLVAIASRALSWQFEPTTATSQPSRAVPLYQYNARRHARSALYRYTQPASTAVPSTQAAASGTLGFRDIDDVNFRPQQFVLATLRAI